MKRPTLQRSSAALLLSLCLSPQLACESQQNAGQSPRSIVGSWKSTDAYSEGTIKFKVVEVVNFASDGSYDGYTKTFENKELSEHERFAGRYELKADRIHWSPKDDEAWSDRFVIGEHELTFRDADGDSMSYVRIGD